MRNDRGENQEISVRVISELKTGSKRLADALLFDGAEILRCYEGSFRFSFKDRPEIVLNVGETLVLFPRHIVTIDALFKKNRLVYGIFDGRDIENYLDSLGFYDCIHGYTDAHFENIKDLEVLADRSRSREDLATEWALFADVLRTQAGEMRRQMDSLVYDAVLQIHRNLQNRIIQLKPLCDQLGVNRVLLHRHFQAAGLGAPSDFIRGKLLHKVRDYLEYGDMPLTAVADRLGFLSNSHFTTFVKRMTGLTPTQVRAGLLTTGWSAYRVS